MPSVSYTYDKDNHLSLISYDYFNIIVVDVVVVVVDVVINIIVLLFWFIVVCNHLNLLCNLLSFESNTWKIMFTMTG